MKTLTLQIVLPLSIISFLFFTKWWYASLIDMDSIILYGFPLIYICKGFHTSLSTQFFLLELGFDVICYFAFWVGFMYVLNRFFTLKISHFFSISLYVLMGMSLLFNLWLAFIPDNRFLLKRDFEVRPIETGYHFIWAVPQNTFDDRYHFEEYQKIEAH